MKLPAIERFMRNVVVLDDGCWAWKGSHDTCGYSIFRLRPGQGTGAHRWIYQYNHGQIAPKLVLDHFACDNRWCVNPEHVRPTTHRENVLRGIGPSAIHARATECLRGHAYDDANTGTLRRGGRYCKACNHLRYLRSKASA